MSLSDSLEHRIQVELNEVAKLLEAAGDIADGLVTLLDHAYEHDHHTREALAAANTFAVTLGRQAALAAERAASYKAARR